MPSWKKVIVSGSDAALNSLNVTSHFTASGINYPTTDGTVGQVIITDGAGNLSFSPVENTAIVIKNVSGATIAKGTPCYITGSGTSGNIAGVVPADASNAARMPAGVIAGETLTAGSEGVGLINGYIADVATSTFNPGDTVYVAVGGGYTNTRPTGSTVLVQKLGNVEKSHATNGSGVINGPGYYNDLPNVANGYTWIGNSNGVATAVATSSIQNVVSSSFSISSSRAVSSSFATTAVTASNVNTLNQSVLITGSLTVGATSAGISENTLTLGPSPAGGAGEGGQLGLNAPGGTYTSASMLDNWQNAFRILRGTNAGSDALVANWSMHTKQMSLPAYNSVSAFPGTATANLAVDSSGNIITVSTSGGSVFPYTGNAVITGSLTTTGVIYATPNGGMYFQGGDDAALYDINVSNHMGIYGVQDSTIGSIKLGSGGGIISGKSSKIGIGTTNPTNGTLEVNGNVYATSFTGSLLGTSSYASNSDLLDGQHGSYYYAASNPNGYTTNTGTVTSVGGTGTVNGISLSGTVTTSGNLTLSGTLSGITNSNLSGTAGITNANLANSAITIAGTSTSLGGSITAATILSGTTVHSGSITNYLPAGTVSGSSQITNIANSQLTNSSITIAGTSVSLGGSIAQSTILAGAGVFSGSAQITGLTNSNLSGTAGITNANLANSAITIAGTSTSLGGTISQATILAGSTVLSGSNTISGVALGGTLEALTAGSYLTSAGTYTGNTARTFAVDATSANTVSKVVARDGSGNFSAGRITTSGLYGTSGTGNIPIWQYDSGNTGYGIIYNESASDTLRFDVSGQALSGTPDFLVGDNYAQLNGSTVWHAGNDGASSGLDADLLDGQHGSYYYAASNPSGYTTNTGTVTSVGGTGTVNGISLSGTVTTSGNLTLGGTLSGIGNSQLTNSTITVGSTAISLGSSATTIAGLSSVTSTTFVGALTGNASTATSAATWTTGRTLTIGSTGKTVDGSGNVSWTLSEIGAQAALTNPVTGTGVNQRVALWSGTTTQTSDANLTFDGSTFNITGTLTATRKSFIIDHPTKPGKRLQYGVLEGPEHSVYVRGRLRGETRIELPDHWHALVHEDSITVNLTAAGKAQDLWVEEITDTYIIVAGNDVVNCFYSVFAERKDIEKLVTEFDKE